MPGIFLSYRRDDAGGWAGRLSSSLRESLPSASVFMDVDNIPPGIKFADYIAQSVAACDVLIALIGPRWASETNLRRLAELNERGEPRDFVRLEIVAALRRNVRVIPTRVGDAQLPSRDALPEDMKDLLDLNDYVISDRSWDDDCRRLVAVLKPLVGVRSVDRRVVVALGGAAVVAAGGIGYLSLRKPAPVAPPSVVISRSPEAASSAPPPSPSAALPSSPSPPAPRYPNPTALLSKPLAGRWQLSADGLTDNLAFVIESVDGGHAIKATDNVRDPKNVGTLKASGDEVVFESAPPQLLTLTASPGSEPGLWALSYVERPTGGGDPMVGRGRAKVDPALRRISADLEFEKRHATPPAAPPARVTVEILISPDARRVQASVTEKGETKTAVFTRL